MKHHKDSEPRNEKPTPAEELEQKEIEQSAEEKNVEVTSHEDDREADAANDEPKETSEANAETPAVVVSRHVGRWHRLMHFFGRHKVWTGIIGVAVVLALLAVVPWTRYKVAGLFLKQTVTVVVVDNQTSAPVTSADVTIAGTSAKTDNHGDAKLHVRVGSSKVAVTKTYYQTKSFSTVVPIFKPKHNVSVRFAATGRQVPVVVTNKITGKPLDNAEVSAAGSEVKTDTKGHATIVLPSDKTSVGATISASGYNDAPTTIQVTTASVVANDFSLTPSGKIYFLSNLSGKIDVVKTNLDGTDRQTVLAGTGNEDPNNTSLLASRDWKYAALESVRTPGGSAQLNLIDTTNGDKVTSIDQGTDVSFSSVGWDGDDFIYTVVRNDVQNWQPNQSALKSYNAQTGKLITLDQTGGGGLDKWDYYKQVYGGVYILNGAVVYAENWQAYDSYFGWLNGKQAALVSVQPDGSDKKTLQSFPIPANVYPASVTIETEPYEANGLYVLFDLSNQYYIYEDGAVKSDPTLNDRTFYDSYDTYLLSPSGNQTFWQVGADGKNNLLIGNVDGDNGKQIATLSDYDVFGWYTDNYLLVSKGGSELYVMPASGGTPIKITDYYASRQDFGGYGSGYGGL